MNKINPEKLLNSKWTACVPKQKEKHFIVSELIRDEEEQIVSCVLQAVMTRNDYTMDWNLLKKNENWLMGWK